MPILSISRRLDIERLREYAQGQFEHDLVDTLAAWVILRMIQIAEDDPALAQEALAEIRHIVQAVQTDDAHR